MTIKLSAVAASVLLAMSSSAFAADRDDHARDAKHVVLISIDGLHQNDLAWFVAKHPASTLARMVSSGVSYTKAHTPFPSDSFPGMLALVTGGHPRTTGVYYDDAYSRSLLPPGTTDCAHAAPGSEVAFAENLDKDPNRLDAGQSIPGLYNNLALISKLTGSAKELIDPAQLPVSPTTCAPVYPHEYLRVNTVFEVLHEKGLRTAWSDKHAAYDILNGPSGRGIDDLFTPEINASVTDPSLPAGPGSDFTKDNVNTQTYDALKVSAVLNWLGGHDHAGNGKLGVPAILGLNFQSVSTAQKLNLSRFVDPVTLSVAPTKGLGGYVTDATGVSTPGPVLQGALAFVDEQVGRLVQASDLRRTVFIVSAKHGQSPEARADLTIINDGDMIDALNAAWTAETGSAQLLVAHAMDDDGVLLWLNDRSGKATRFAKTFLEQYAGVGIGTDATGAKTAKPFTNAGLKAIYAGAEAAEFIGAPRTDDRVPDLIGIAHRGTVYAGSKLSKIAEHGGHDTLDRHVGLVIFGAGIRHAVVDDPVDAAQVAPTILRLLGVKTHELRAVREEHTRALPLHDEDD
jgi:hypothetical protein